MKKILLYLETMQRGGAERVLNNIATYLSDEYEVILVNDVIFSQDQEYVVDERVKRYCLEMTGGGVKGNVIRVKKLRKIIKSERPDVVLSFKGACNLRMLMAALGIKIKKYVSVRNDPVQEYDSCLAKLAVKLLFKSASGCVFQTRDAMDYFQESVKKKSRIIWNPVADKFFEHAWAPVREEIAVVGRLVPQKIHCWL